MIANQTAEGLLSSGHDPFKPRNYIRRSSGAFEVPQSNGAGILLIRENTLLPPNRSVESEDFMPGWRIVTNFDGYALSRKIKGTNWSFVHLAGEKKTRVLGGARHGTMRRGISRILTELRGRRFNSLEITVVVLKRFLGLTYLSLSANLRHLQDDATAGT
jgi:hypothetical protein